jgi:uncharacterized SAM-binding protein YcdF (DUF218 family)
MNKKQNLPLILASLVFVVLLTGDLLLWFYLDYRRVEPPRLPATVHKVDAAAVLAGGPGRLRQGYDLLRQERTNFLLIIGANPRSRSRDILTTLAPAAAKEEKQLSRQVIIENRSYNTLTNILALRDLCREHNFHSLVIVTSTFHLKRAYHLCKKILPPQLKVYYQPIPPKSGVNSAVPEIPLTLRIKEFIKYLNARLQLAGRH